MRRWALPQGERTSGGCVSPKGKGYSERFGDRIIGTFSKSAGKTTPWGTLFSAEENFPSYVPEPVNQLN